jgi:3-methyladenine DNA glycosylase AlkD
MDEWCKDFDSWAICDTACFHLFDKTPHAFAKVEKWSTRKPEFEKRAAFALLASLALHDKKAEDAPFLKTLSLIERAANDERNFVKKGVSWALRGIGLRKSPALRRAARELAKELAGRADAGARWVGKDAEREFAKKDRAG